MDNNSENTNKYFFSNEQESQDSQHLMSFTAKLNYTSTLPALRAKSKQSGLLSFLPTKPEDANQQSFSANEQEVLYSDQVSSSPIEQPPLYPDSLLLPANEQSPPLQAEPRKKPKNWVLILAFVVVFLAGYGIGHIGSGSSTATTTTKTVVPSNQVTPATTQGPKQSPTDQHFHTGDVVTTGPTWQVVVKSVKTDDGGPYSALKPGDTYMVVEISLTNISNNAQVISSILNFMLEDGKAGQKYEESIDTNAGATLDGNVEPGSQLHGVIAYEVPSSVTSFALHFSQSTPDASTYIWDLNL